VTTAAAKTALNTVLAAPGYAPDKPATSKPETGVTIADKLAHGNLTIEEVCALRPRSRAGFYEDVAAGLVAIKKIGRRTVIPGPIARAYIAGESIA
jgi:hypothetical protein